MRCDVINLEKKLNSNSWDKRVNMSIFGISVFCTCNVTTNYLAYEYNFCVFFYDLSEEMIDNDLDSRPNTPP